MSIRIIEDGPEITLTESEAAHLRREWQQANSFTTRPSTFEEFVRSRKTRERLDLARGIRSGSQSSGEVDRGSDENFDGLRV